jgi:hypothetical protein
VILPSGTIGEPILRKKVYCDSSFLFPSKISLSDTKVAITLRKVATDVNALRVNSIRIPLLSMLIVPDARTIPCRNVVSISMVPSSVGHESCKK